MLHLSSQINSSSSKHSPLYNQDQSSHEQNITHRREESASTIPLVDSFSRQEKLLLKLKANDEEVNSFKGFQTWIDFMLVICLLRFIFPPWGFYIFGPWILLFIQNCILRMGLKTKTLAWLRYYYCFLTLIYLLLFVSLIIYIRWYILVSSTEREEVEEMVIHLLFMFFIATPCNPVITLNCFLVRKFEKALKKKEAILKALQEA